MIVKIIKQVKWRLLLIVVGLSQLKCSDNVPHGLTDHTAWVTYAGTKDGIRYSSNSLITTDNVSGLRLAWTYSSGDRDTNNRSQIQCNPSIIDGVLYGTSPRNKLFALDAMSGSEKWVFDPFASSAEVKNSSYTINRGIVFWRNEETREGRIFYCVGPQLYAINAENGVPIKEFGSGGAIDLREGLDLEKNTDITRFYASGTTPGVIYKDLLIMGMRVTENMDALPGHIRAFDVRTGKRRWIFHTIPHPGEKGYKTWEDPDAWKRVGGANNWGGMALDEHRGIVYIPTGSASPDLWGGLRKGQNLFANSIIALNAATGKYKWHYQAIHHDLWDRDLPANPGLVTVNRNGKKIDAIAQITKHGYVFLLDRRNGKPIFPIEERPVPVSESLPGEKVWPTQPVPTLPVPFARQKFGLEDISDLTPETNSFLIEKYYRIKHNTPFAPPSKAGSWVFPGFDGGGEWGGASIDPESQTLFVNSSELPWSLTMRDVPAKNTLTKDLGKAVYTRHCMTCHGDDRKGNGQSFPSLMGIETKYDKAQLAGIIDNGRNMMPGFKHIPREEKDMLMAFLLGLESTGAGTQAISEINIQPKEQGKVIPHNPFASTGYTRFLDENGYPGIKPPWGTLNAINLNSGELMWKVPLGEYEELTKRGVPVTGTENYGGPVVTKGGLVFIAATKDEKIRAFDKKTGKVLWEGKLPAAGYATPAIYVIGGKQFVVIACGGGKIGSKSGDTYVAFALPE